MARVITIDEELEELKRELDERKREYPSLIRGPKPTLKREEAVRRFARLESAIKRLEELKSKKVPAPQGEQTMLFTDEENDVQF